MSTPKFPSFEPANDDVQWNRTIAEVEVFIKRLYEQYYVIRPKDDAGKKLAILLGSALDNYEQWKHQGRTMRQVQAPFVKGTIDRAFAYGIIEEGNGVIGKYQGCQDECDKLHDQIKQLDEEKKKWYDEARTWKNLYEDLYKKFGNWTNGSNDVFKSDFKGDLEDAK